MIPWLYIPHPPRKRPSRRGRLGPNTAPSGLLIVSVTLSPAVDTQLIVTFSGPIVWNGVDTPQAFKAWTHDGMMDSCIGVISVGGDWIEVEFNAGVDAGAAWEIVGEMAGITPDVVWPQNGIVGA